MSDYLSEFLLATGVLALAATSWVQTREIARLRKDLHETRDAVARSVYYWLTKSGDLDE